MFPIIPECLEDLSHKSSLSDQLDQSYFLIPLSPPKFACDDFDDILLYSNYTTITSAPPCNKNPLSSSTDSSLKVPSMSEKKLESGIFGSKRVGRKDRHSKISTATGMRDRRMRLSLEVARKFFDLQDLLGFDKASSTVQWLLTKSRGAIKELSAKLLDSTDVHSSKTTESSTLEHEDTPSKGKSIKKACRATKLKKVKQEASTKIARKAKLVLQSELTRESRARARERARERTREKRLLWNYVGESSVCSDAKNACFNSIVSSMKVTSCATEEVEVICSSSQYMKLVDDDQEEFPKASEYYFQNIYEIHDHERESILSQHWSYM